MRNFASSSGRTRDLELLEIQNREGPCYDCVASGQRIEDVAPLDSRVVIEQAKGMLAIHHSITIDEAFTKLRTQARSQKRRLTDLAQEITTRQDPE